MLLYLSAFLAAAAVFLVIYGVRTVAKLREQDRITRRLGEISGTADQQTPTTVLYISDRSLPLIWKIVAFLGWLLPGLVTSENLLWELFQAGYRRPEARGLYAGAKVTLLLLLGGATVLVLTTFHLWPDKIVFLTIAACLFGYFLPNLFVSLRQSKRREQIMLTLPDALDLMVVCVEAGQGLNAALLNVGSEIRIQAPALSEELQLVNQEIRMGVGRGQALRNFAARTGVEEARALAAVLIQSDRLGTSIARALRVHADSMRTRRRQRAEEAARKTPVKLVFPLVFFIFPELLVVILAPAMLRLFRVLAASASGG